MRIGVFDSGIGGEAVAASLSTEFPDATILTASDREHVPYGDRPSDEIKALTDAALQPLLAAQCNVIVIACNTATAVAITWLRERYPAQAFIGLEPMLKPAARLTKSGVVAVCATPATLASDRYLEAKRTFLSGVTVVEPDCSDWARLIENDEINEEKIEAVARQSLGAGADVIVLGCTHYHWVKAEIEVTVGSQAVILEPSEAIARRVRELLNL